MNRVTDSEKYLQAKKIFLELCDLQASEIPDRLKNACSGDRELEKEVRSLIDHHIGSSTSSDSSSTGFGHSVENSVHPDQIIGSRYRIMMPLGSGGMGKVWLAHDQILNLDIAIKFLNQVSPAHLQRLQNEVKLARKINNPFVCKVYDIGEAGGLHFITMDYIRGEDLSSLLKRVGRLTPERLVLIAQQLCQGLAATHANGIIHRDLKPANIMIDQQGNVVIMDFGIATAREWPDGTGRFAGTPAYMAPEQFIPGSQVDERSDLFSLGLVLYEALTGKAAYEPSSIFEAANLHAGLPPRKPSELIGLIDPALEKAVLWAMDPDPEKRPRTALHLAAALPGLDALGIAWQAGVTPPPDLMADIRPVETISRKLKWSFLAALIVLLLTIWSFSESRPGGFYNKSFKAPQVLADYAREILNSAGYTGSKYLADYGFLNDPSDPDNLSNLKFWYREIRPSLPPKAVQILIQESSSERENIRIPVSEMAATLILLLDPDKKLVMLRTASVYPIDWDSDSFPPSTDLYKPLFNAAGLEYDCFIPIRDSEPPVLCDSSFTFRPGNECSLDRNMFVSAAAMNGRPVYFAPSSSMHTESDVLKREVDRRNLLAISYIPFHVLLLTVSIILSIINIRRRRTDWWGTSVLFVSVVVLILLEWILNFGHVAHPIEQALGMHFEHLILTPLFVCCFYMGLEPYARRHIPHTLVDWNKLTSGAFRDSKVGFSLLAGTVAGAAIVVIDLIDAGIARWAGYLPSIGNPTAPVFEAAMKVRYCLARSIQLIPDGISYAIVGMFLFTIIRALVRKKTASGIIFLVIHSAMWGILGYQSPFSFLFFAPGISLLALLVMIRAGFLAMITAAWTAVLIENYPLTTHLDTWYAETGFFAVTTTLGIALLAMWLLRNPRKTRIA